MKNTPLPNTHLIITNGHHEHLVYSIDLCESDYPDKNFVSSVGQENAFMLSLQLSDATWPW